MPDSQVHKSAPIIAAARKYTLAIIGLAALALQIGWMEKERLNRLTLFAYFDKALTVHSLLKTGRDADSLDVAETSLGPDAAPIAILGAGEQNPMALVRRAMVGESFSEVSFPGQTDELMTLTDPGGRCTVRVFRGNGDGRFLVDEFSSLNRFQRFSQVMWISAAHSYSVLFGRNCVFQLESNEPVVLYSEPSSLSWGMILPGELLRLGDFPGAFEAPQKREDFLFFHGDELTEEELDRFEGIDAPIARAYSIETAIAFIIESASVVSGRSFPPSEWESALGELVKSQATSPTILGITLPPQLAVVVMPLALLLLALIVFHRTRRINKSDPEEPWILLEPRGFVERAAAGVWVVALLSAPLLVIWSGRIYDPNGFEVFTSNAEALVTSLEVVDRYTADSLTRTENLAQLSGTAATYMVAMGLLSELLILSCLMRIASLNSHGQPRWFAATQDQARWLISTALKACHRRCTAWRKSLRRNEEP